MAIPTAAVEPPTLHGGDAESDAELVHDVAAVVAEPRRDEADSFVLHAPLELLARLALLPYVRPHARGEARARLAAVGDGFTAFGPAVAPPAPRSFDSVASAAAALAAAIGRGELDEVDTAAHWLGHHATADELRAALADDLVPRLAAAGHAPIFLYLLPRVAPRREVTGELLRPLARELARQPTWRIRWIDRPRQDDTAPLDVFEAALAATPALGPPPSTFIHPLVSRVDGDLAASLLGPVTGGDDIAARGRAVLRAAAWTMLAEPGEHAPYGWTHALTLPQAVLGVAGAMTSPSRALAIAATYLVAFRASLSSAPLTTTAPAPHPAGSLADALDADPHTAAAVAWHHPADRRGELLTELATRASTHEDAHLVKYTLACFDAAADDPAHARLFLAAAASLSAWWTVAGRP